MAYRKRIYDAYVFTHWQYFHHSTLGEYEYTKKLYHRRFMSFLPQDKDAKIMDVACGGGHFLYFLQQEGYRQTQGIDISQEAVEVARKMRVENTEVGDLFQILPLHKDEFDFISANDIVEHLRKDEVLDFLDSVYAALKPGGRILMMTLNATSLFGARTVFDDFTHEIGFTPRSLAQVLRVCGFENVAVYGDEPVALTVSSGIRALLWKLLKVVLRIYLAIEGTISFKIWRQEVILEPSMFVVAKKPTEEAYVDE